MISDAFSMGMGDWLSERAELQYKEAERRRERWECENNLDEEKREMIDLYVKKGLDPMKAVQVVDLLASNQEVLLDVMMVEELGILPPDPHEAPWKVCQLLGSLSRCVTRCCCFFFVQHQNGLVTFFSFIVFGLLPLAVYGIGSAAVLGVEQSAGHHNSAANVVYAICCVVTSMTLFLLGAITSRFTSQKWYAAGFFMMLNGIVAACVSYGIGFVLQQRKKEMMEKLKSVSSSNPQ
jgi:DNA damage-binding protein 1